MKKYTHLLFDLDHTLWDFNSNCKQTLNTLYINHELAQYDIPFNEFHRRYLEINNKVWKLYDLDKITKEELRDYRFNELLNQFDIRNQELATKLEHHYLNHCPKNGLLIPHAKELLENLQSIYNLNIITNGFEETQRIKMEYSNISHYFDSIFTSESVGYKKPDSRYFSKVLETLGVEKNDCLVIGDNPTTDIKGASDYGIDTAWINTQNFPKTTKSTYYFKDLKSFETLLTSYLPT